MVFLHEPVGVMTYIGIAALMISLFLINMKKENVKFSFVWVVWLIIEFAGNGTCAIVQKMQQLRFDGAYKNEFMIVALAFVMLVFLCIVLAEKKDNKKEALKECIKYAPVAGVANGAVNMMTMVLTAMLPSSILFPVISAGGIVITFIISLTVYKEKLSKMQYIGYVIGIFFVIMLNI